MPTRLDKVTTYEVLRPFEANGCRLQRGEIVETSGWRPGRAKRLAEQRYLAISLPDRQDSDGEAVPTSPGV